MTILEYLARNGPQSVQALASAFRAICECVAKMQQAKP